MDKGPLDSAVFIIFFNFPHKTVHPFRNCLAVLPPPTMYKVLYARVQLRLWGEGRGWALENAPEMQMCPMTFVHECSYVGLGGEGKVRE